MSKQLIGYVDCETTGLIPGRHGLIEFTIAIVDPSGLIELDRFQSGQMALPPGSVEVSPEALKVNGYSADTLHLGKNPVEVAAAAAEFIGRYNAPLVLMAHNAAFDWAWLEHFFGTYDIPIRNLFSHRKIDIQSFIVARNVLAGKPEASSSLDNCAKEWGIEKPEIHTSNSDVTVGLELARRLFGCVKWSSFYPPETGVTPAPKPKGKAK